MLTALQRQKVFAMTELTVTLPDDLALQAKQVGLLRSEAIAELIAEAIRSRKVERLFTTIDKLTDLAPPLTEDEIQAELDAARSARRANAPSR
jgi:post-segregation antitoxin (ccd killing protein)